MSSRPTCANCVMEKSAASDAAFPSCGARARAACARRPRPRLPRSERAGDGRGPQPRVRPPAAPPPRGLQEAGARSTAAAGEPRLDSGSVPAFPGEVLGEHRGQTSAPSSALARDTDNERGPGARRVREAADSVSSRRLWHCLRGGPRRARRRPALPSLTWSRWWQSARPAAPPPGRWGHGAGAEVCADEHSPGAAARGGVHTHLPFDADPAVGGLDHAHVVASVPWGGQTLR